MSYQIINKLCLNSDRSISSHLDSFTLYNFRSAWGGGFGDRRNEGWGHTLFGSIIFKSRQFHLAKSAAGIARRRSSRVTRLSPNSQWLRLHACLHGGRAPELFEAYTSAFLHTHDASILGFPIYGLFMFCQASSDTRSRNQPWQASNRGFMPYWWSEMSIPPPPPPRPPPHPKSLSVLKKCNHSWNTILMRIINTVAFDYKSKRTYKYIVVSFFWQIFGSQGDKFLCTHFSCLKIS